MRTTLRFAIVALAAFTITASSGSAQTTYNLTAGGASAWTAASWNPAGPADGAGNLAIYGSVGSSATTTLDTNITLGQIRASGNPNASPWTISAGAGVFTLDNTGGSANPFGTSTAFIGVTSASALTVTADISMSNTDLSVGISTTGAAGTVLIGGNITATAGQTRSLFLRNVTSTSGNVAINSSIGATISNSTINISNNNTATTSIGSVALNGDIGGATGVGSTVTISNTNAGTGTFTILGNLGQSVTSITQNSFTSAMSITGASNGSYAGITTVNGGILNFTNANGLGTSTVAVNYGGTLRPNGNFSPTNVIAIAIGGTYNAINATSGSITAFGTGSTVASGGILNNSSTLQMTIATANVTLPSAGVLFNEGSNSINVTGAYPTPTGTLAFGGSIVTNALITTVATTITTNQTLAFNSTSGTNFSGMVQLFGTTLSNGVTLTIAGSGITTLAGLIPQSGASGSLGTGPPGLGSVTTASGSSAIVVAMAPLSAVRIPVTATGYNGLTVTGGTVVSDKTNTVSLKFGTAGVTLNGGGIRNLNDANNNSTYQDAFTIGAGGGTLETFSTGNVQLVTFTGALSGSGPLTLRYGGAGTNTSSVILAGTGNAGYTGAITLATSNKATAGYIQFTGAASVGNASRINAAAGVVFQFDSNATAAALTSLFVTDPDAILAFNNITPTLGSGGNFVKDVWVTNATGGGLAIPAMTPFASTYKFTPMGGGTMNLSAANRLTGGNHLHVRAAAASPGSSTQGQGGQVFVSTSQNYTGTTLVEGTFGNALTGGGTLTTNLFLSTGGDLAGTSGVTVGKAGVLNVAGSSGAITAGSTAGIILRVMGGGSLTNGSNTATANNSVTNRLNLNDTLILGGTEGGGTFTMAYPAATFTHAQSLVTLTVESGLSTINTVNTAAGVLNLTFSGAAATNYTRSAAGAVNFTLPTTTSANTVAFGAGATTVTIATGLTNVYIGMPVTGTGLAGGTYVTSYASGTGVLGLSQGTSSAQIIGALTASYVANNTAISFSNTPANVIGGLLVGATVNGNEFLAPTGGANFVVPAYTYKSSANTWSTGENIASSINTAFSGTVPMVANAFAVNSLRSSAAGNGTLVVGTNAVDVLTISSGMLLHTPNNSLVINGPGAIASGNGRDYFFQVNQNTVTIGARLSSALPLTKLGGGTLTIQNTTNAITDTYLLAGSLFISNSVTTLGSGGVINLLGGTLGIGAGTIPTATLSNAYSLVVGAAGGTFQSTANGTIFFNGTVTMNGRLTLNSPDTGNVVRITLGGTLSGPGTLRVQTPLSNGGTTVATLSGNNANWTGGISFDFTTGGSTTAFLRLDHGNAAGTGPIAAAAKTALYLLNNTANATIANDIIGVPVLVNWATSNPVTLSGRFFSTNGLNVQGFAATSVASELVLAGTVAIAGSPLLYNWNSTPTTATTNFVNATSGITVGSTGFQGQTPLLGGSASALNNLSIDSPVSGKLTQGALGIVRFSGVNSFIPGAVGPGYLAALHQANDATDYGNGTVAGSTGGANALFGFMVTGGSTYTIPEGKSFVIGSLGTSVAVGSGQVGGVLGSTGSGTNTAVLIGSPKLAGFNAGDVNIHANAVGDAQSLSLLARNSTDTLQLGTVATPLVFSPTTGDSGAASAITLLSTRTGATAINKIGLGTVEVRNVQFNNIAGLADSAKTGVTLNVNAGTLNYAQTDSATAYAAVNVNAGGTLSGNGTISGATTVLGTVAPGPLVGPLSFNTGLAITGGTYAVDLETLLANSDLLAITGALNLSGTTTLSVTGTPGASNTYTIATFTSLSGTFTNVPAFVGVSHNLVYNTGSIQFTPLTVVPEPGTLGLAFTLLIGGLVRRRLQS